MSWQQKWQKNSSGIAIGVIEWKKIDRILLLLTKRVKVENGASIQLCQEEH